MKRRGVRGAAIAYALTLVACGAAMAPRATPAGAPDAMTMRPGDSHAEIERLGADIAAREQAAGVAAPDAEAIAAAQPMSATDAAGVCVAPLTPPAACTDTCTLATAICDDAAAICRLADDLVGDAWAADRCAAGKASCQAAKQRCCDCH
ncbi:MAG: hypothetical protein K8W52_13160 [Deltaproteobacteria bacterium]|nr:hypothetical protein [Deltaproteobacteria bacterium]